MTRPSEQGRKDQRGALVAAGLGLVAVLVLGALFLRSTSDERSATGSLDANDPGPVHVHGLGVNPADGALFIATHTGLFRVSADQRKAQRIADRYQDTMGFTIVGPNRFLGSGHPDARDDLPPLLGLIEPTDSGESWKPISLLGEADFHVLRFAGERVYGFDASNDRLLASADGGRTWKELERPGPIVDLAADPNQASHIVTTTGNGLFASRDGGRNWAGVGPAVGLLAWPTREHFYLVDGEGKVYVSRTSGRRLIQRGEIGGQPAAFVAAGANELYVALHDGTIKGSGDGGATWSVRSTP